jgi:phosphohistidine swiveling domain-containing protein
MSRLGVAEDIDAASSGRAMLYGTKAQVLKYLGSKLSSAIILPTFIFKVTDWREDPKKILDDIVSEFTSTLPLILRSSRRDEGNGVQSHAGEFLSILGVVGPQQISCAIDQVIHSYGRYDPEDEVLVQPLAEGLDASGVALNCDLRNQLPYIVVNLSSGSDSSIVTGGRSGTRTFYFVRNGPSPPSEMIRPVVALIEELELHYPEENIEIEFGIRDDEVFLFQCRSLRSGGRRSEFADSVLLQSTVKAAASAGYCLSRSTDSFGAGALGIMPDWNPAEMIGLKPTPLAYDLYEYLITGWSWSVARFQQGYSDLRGTPLMHKIGGTPYIDVGASIASFVPAGLPSTIGQAVVSLAMERLAANPHLHDKLEFELLSTCYKPATESCMLLGALPSADRGLYAKALSNLTNSLIVDGGSFDSDLSQVAEVEHKFRRLRSLPMNERPRLAAQLKYVREHVAPLFGKVARAAFVATDIIRDIERRQGGGSALRASLLDGLETVSAEVMRDYAGCPHEQFLQRHGHVRPGTYDIRVPSYEEAPDGYFSNEPRRIWGQSEGRGGGAADAPELDLGRLPYEFDLRRLVDFSERAIRAREYVKYLYAGFVSEALRLIVDVAKQIGRHREDLAFLRLDDLLEQGVEGALTNGAEDRIAAAREQWTSTRGLRLPGLMFGGDDVFSFEDVQNVPNFVTPTRVVAELVSTPLTHLNGRIVLLEQADPGYDWIFTHNIAGLITAYGGLNSHMAVRCRERNLPSAIGVGATTFARLQSASRALIDGAAQRVEIYC